MARLRSLKNRLRRKIPGNIDEFTTRWSGHSIATDHLDAFCDRVYERLSTAMTEELDLAAKLTPLRREIESYADFAKDRMRGFMGRQAQVGAVIRLRETAA